MLQAEEQQQDLKSRQADLTRAATDLSKAEREIAAMKSKHAQQPGYVQETADNGVNSQLESLQKEHQQVEFEEALPSMR